MNKPFLSVGQWKCLLVALTVYSAGLNLWSALHWERFAVPDKVGVLPFDVGTPDRDYRLPILKLDPRSALAQAGAKLGDTLVFDHAGDIRRGFATAEAVGVTWYAGGQPHHVVITAVPDPDVARSPYSTAFVYVIDLLFSWGALLLALLIGLRLAGDGAMRGFSTMLALTSANTHAVLPGGAFQSFLVQAEVPFLLFGVYISFTYFSLTYPQGDSCWRSAWARRSFKVYVVLFALIAVTQVAENYAVLPPGWRALLPPSKGKLIASAVSVLWSLGAIWLAWRRATGVTRQRLAWVGVCMGTIYATYFVYNINVLLGAPVEYASITNQIETARLLALAALGYALLRYRLFDFGFVINRALVATIISTFLLIVFAVTEWSVDKLLHFEGREKNVIFDAAVALAIILCFHRIQHWVSHKVDHTFFRRWYEAAEGLRRFLSKTAQITESQALQSKYAQALSEFSGTSGVSIFLGRPDGSMALCHATLADSPAEIDANHDILIDLRHARQVLRLEAGATGLAGELALPMMTQGRLRGLVLLGAKPNQQQYRPDEIALLATAAQQLGMDLESLRAIELERQIDSLAHLETSLAAAQQQSTTLEQAYLALEREAALLRQLVRAEPAPSMT
jgi:hypothetical protein